MADEHCRSRMCRRRLSRLQSVSEFRVSEKPVQKTERELEVKTLLSPTAFDRRLLKKNLYCVYCMAILTN